MGRKFRPGFSKIIGKNNRLFTIDGGGHFLGRNVEFKNGKSVGLRVIGRCLGSEAGFENIGNCEPDSSAGQSVSVPDSLLESGMGSNVKALKFELDESMVGTKHSLVVNFDMQVEKVREVELGYSFFGMGRCSDVYAVDTTSLNYFTVEKCYQYCLEDSACNGFAWKETSSGGHCARSLTHCPKMGYSNYVTEALPDAGSCSGSDCTIEGQVCPTMLLVVLVAHTAAKIQIG